MKSRIAAEIRCWRWTWIGIAVAIGMPIYVRNSPQHALVFGIVGLSLALTLRGMLDGPDPAWRRRTPPG
jgi:phosphate/sulfate permease